LILNESAEKRHISARIVSSWRH